MISLFHVELVEVIFLYLSLIFFLTSFFLLSRLPKFFAMIALFRSLCVSDIISC